MTRAVKRERQADATLPLVSLSDAALLCGMVVLWGLSWPMMKLSVEHAPPLWLAVLRFATSSMCLFGLGLFRHDIRLPTYRDLPIIASIGLLQMAAFTALGMVAMTFIDAGKASLLAYSTPLWSVLIAWAIDGPPTTIDWTPKLVLLILYFGPVATSFCFVVSAEVGRRISVFAMSNLTLGVPIIGTAASISFLGERLSLTSLSGFVLIVSGIAIAVYAVRRKARTEDRTRERNNRQQQFFPTDRV